MTPTRRPLADGRMAAPGPRPSRPWSWPRQALVAAAVAVVLALVFAAYLNPHLMVDLANAVWACF